WHSPAGEFCPEIFHSIALFKKVLVCLAIILLQLLILFEASFHPLHNVRHFKARGLGSQAWVRQVIQRRKWCAIVQPGCSLDNSMLVIRRVIDDIKITAWFTAELLGNDCEICVIYGHAVIIPCTSTGN